VWGSLSSPPHWKGDMPVNPSQPLRVDKIPSSFDSIHTYRKPEQRKGNLFKATSCHTTTAADNGLWTYYNRKWVIVLFI
jgi:hypothetical protein